MRGLFAGLAASSLMLAITTAPAVAQREDIKVRGYFGFGVGPSVPVGDYGQGFKTGLLVNVLGGFTTRGGVFGGRLDGMFAQNNLKGGQDGNTRLIGLNADVVLTPGHRPLNVHPYILAGVGLYHANPTTGSSTTKPALNAGAGVQFHTGRRMDVFVEGRFVTILTSGANTNFVPLAVGLRFGGI